MAFVADEFFSGMDVTTSNEWVDFDQFLDLPTGYDDQSTATTVSPQDLALPFETDGIPSDFMQSSFDMASYDLPQEDFMGMDGGFMQDPAAPLFDDTAFLEYNPYDSTNTFRNLVEAQAAADPRVATIKEKRREAAIALHLQRLCDATALDLDMSSDSNTSFSSPSWSEYVRGSSSPRPSPENTSVSEGPPPGGMEMVLDLNMNAAANVPKKQKPRSQAQKENYIKARKYGACEKHKKQHKRVSFIFTLNISNDHADRRVVQLPGEGCCSCHCHRCSNERRTPGTAEATDAPSADPRGALLGLAGSQHIIQLTSNASNHHDDQETTKHLIWNRAIRGTACCGSNRQANCQDESSKECAAGSRYYFAIWQARLQVHVESRQRSTIEQKHCERSVSRTRHTPIWKEHRRRLIRGTRKTSYPKEGLKERRKRTTPRPLQFKYTSAGSHSRSARWQLQLALARFDLFGWCRMFRKDGCQDNILGESCNRRRGSHSRSRCTPNEAHSHDGKDCGARYCCWQSWNAPFRIARTQFWNPSAWTGSQESFRGACQPARNTLWLAVCAEGSTGLAGSAWIARSLWKRITG